MLFYDRGNAIDFAVVNNYNLGHGCNSFCKMGTGFAAQVKRRLPELYQVDQATKRGDRSKPGTNTHYLFDWGYGFNLYTQYWYSWDFTTVGLEHLLNSLESAFALIRKTNFQPLVLPRIGSGAAGGDWSLIEPVLEFVAQRKNDIIVIDFDRSVSKHKRR